MEALASRRKPGRKFLTSDHLKLRRLRTGGFSVLVPRFAVYSSGFGLAGRRFHRQQQMGIDQTRTVYATLGDISKVTACP